MAELEEVNSRLGGRYLQASTVLVPVVGAVVLLPLPFGELLRVPTVEALVVRRAKLEHAAAALEAAGVEDAVVDDDDLLRPNTMFLALSSPPPPPPPLLCASLSSC